MTHDVGDGDVRDFLVDVAPLGLICGGIGTPLRETWIDLSSPNQVFYGLNGAGKTTILESLHGALNGHCHGAKILARMPFDADRLSGALNNAMSEMLVGYEYLDDAGHVHREFVEAQREDLWSEFTRRQTRHDWSVEGSQFDALDWSPLLDALAASQHWLFTPIGTDTGRWSASPVVLIDPDGKWSEHLKELTLLEGDDSGPLIRELGFDLMWWETPPDGAPAGIVGTLVERLTERKPWRPWWPFGQVVADDVVDASALTRQHLVTHPADRHGSNLETIEDEAIMRGHETDLRKKVAELSGRVAEIQRRANVVLPELLADAPVLHLDLGDDADWFAGRSCSWWATRFEGDSRMSLSMLSSAERRWAHVAISLALTDDLNAAHHATNLALTEDLDAGNGTNRVAIIKTLGTERGFSGTATTWLLLDEPERGLHRTAEAQMARGIKNGISSGLRFVLATHSPELLDHDVGEVSYVRRRSHDRPGTVISMRAFDGVREDLGLDPSDMLRRTRGIALLEGEHDLEVLAAMIGVELERLGVVLLATRGGRGLKTVVDSRFLYEFTDAVLFPILDDLTLDPVSELWGRQVVAARTKPASDVIHHLKVGLRALSGKGREFLEEFLAASVKNGTFERVHPLGIPQTDVLMCLPVTAFVPGAETWDQVREEARRSRGGKEPSETDFKKFLEKSHRADLSAENIRRVAEKASPHPDIKAILAAISARLSR